MHVCRWYLRSKSKSTSSRSNAPGTRPRSRCSVTVGLLEFCFLPQFSSNSAPASLVFIRTHADSWRPHRSCNNRSTMARTSANSLQKPTRTGKIKNYCNDNRNVVITEHSPSLLHKFDSGTLRDAVLKTTLNQSRMITTRVRICMLLKSSKQYALMQ